jgi:hypothetical protein
MVWPLSGFNPHMVPALFADPRYTFPTHRLNRKYRRSALSVHRLRLYSTFLVLRGMRSLGITYPQATIGTCFTPCTVLVRVSCQSA